MAQNTRRSRSVGRVRMDAWRVGGHFARIAVVTLTAVGVAIYLTVFAGDNKSLAAGIVLGVAVILVVPVWILKVVLDHITIIMIERSNDHEC